MIKFAVIVDRYRNGEPQAADIFTQIMDDFGRSRGLKLEKSLNVTRFGLSFLIIRHVGSECLKPISIHPKV